MRHSILICGQVSGGGSRQTEMRMAYRYGRGSDTYRSMMRSIRRGSGRRSSRYS